EVLQRPARVRAGRVQLPTAARARTNDVLVFVPVLNFRVVLHPQPAASDVQTVDPVHHVDHALDPARQDRRRRDVDRPVRVGIDVRQIATRRPARDEHGGEDAQDRVSHGRSPSLGGYGRTDKVKPRLRAVGSWPFSTPWRLPVSNVVSGSIVDCLAQRSRLRPTSATVASAKPKRWATDWGKAYARRSSRSFK